MSISSCRVSECFVFQGFGPFHLDYQTYRHKVIDTLPWLYFNVLKICRDVLSFTYDFIYLCPISFFLVSLTRSFSLLFIFSKNQLLFSWFFSTELLFLVSLIIIHNFITYFLKLTWEFICSSFPSFLRLTLEWLILDISSFLMYIFNAINFLVSTVFAASYQVW